MHEGRKQDEERDVGPLADEASGTGTTIVGGQPPRPGRRPLHSVPVGLEQVLYTAAIDPVFREALLRDRDRAVRERGLTLRDSELAMLRLAPASQLSAAIAGLDTSATNLARRGFLRTVAASVVTLAAADALGGCGEDTRVKGIRPDDAGPELAVQGIRPDDASVQPDLRQDSQPRDTQVVVDTPPPTRGIQPDDTGI